MKDFWAFLVAYKHEIWVGLKVWFWFIIISSAIGAIPMPKDDAPHWKRVGFAVLNTAAGNAVRAFCAVFIYLLKLIRAIRGQKED